MENSKLFIGTSGWSYTHWADIFYPPGIKPIQYLEYYLTRFNCVEINSSFYHLPRRTTVESWMKRTPESFWFCPKLSRFITHQKRLKDIDEPLEFFFNVFEAMKVRTGPVLIQLPPGMKYDEVRIRDVLDLFRKKYSNYRFAFEVRHQSWISDSFFNLLREYQAALVFADSGNRFLPFHEEITTDMVYLRFHGPGDLYASEYSEYDLALYAEKIHRWLDRDLQVWAFFNNDCNGYSVRNAELLKTIIHGFYSDKS
ncbi:MAG: DUF72 domain-containing protein [Prolixibacteraceae bacterium]